MEIDDMNTMDVETDTDYEPTDSAEPVVAAREACQKHSFRHNASIDDKSPVAIFDREEHHPKHGRPSITGPERPGAFKTNGSRQARCVRIDENNNTYHNAVAYSQLYGRCLTTFVFW